MAAGAPTMASIFAYSVHPSHGAMGPSTASGLLGGRSGWDQLVIVVLLLVAAAYAAAVLRLWSRAGAGRGVRVWEASAFAAGWLTLLVALGSPLDALSKGTRFDAGQYAFTIGANQVIGGFDQGVRGMRVGGVRRVVVPPSLGYGAGGVQGVIPPNATLIFEIELLEIRDRRNVATAA